MPATYLGLIEDLIPPDTQHIYNFATNYNIIVIEIPWIFLLSPPLWGGGGTLLQTHLRGELIEIRGLIQWSKDDGISSPQRTTIQSRKAWVQEVEGHAAEDQKQVQTPSWWINHPGSVLTKFYSHDWLIKFIIY